MAGNEKDFLGELKTAFEGLGAYWYKIPDSPVYKGMGTRFNCPRPFDALCILDGIPIAIEAKFQNSFSAFGLKNIRESQFHGLTSFEAAGGKAFVALNIHIKPVDGRARVNRLILFDWAEFRNLKQNFSTAELKQLAYCKGSRGTFDLNDLYAEIFPARKRGIR